MRGSSNLQKTNLSSKNTPSPSNKIVVAITLVVKLEQLPVNTSADELDRPIQTKSPRLSSSLGVRRKVGNFFCIWYQLDLSNSPVLKHIHHKTRKM